MMMCLVVARNFLKFSKEDFMNILDNLNPKDIKIVVDSTKNTLINNLKYKYF